MVVTSGPVHISSGRMTKSEIRKQKSKIILQNGDLFNEVEDRTIIGANTLDHRANRGKLSSSTIHIQSNEPDYSPDILDNGKLSNLNLFVSATFLANMLNRILITTIYNDHFQSQIKCNLSMKRLFLYDETFLLQKTTTISSHCPLL